MKVKVSGGTIYLATSTAFSITVHVNVDNCGSYPLTTYSPNDATYDL